MAEKKRKPGRPRKPINHEQVEQMAAIGCTDPEIATIMDVAESTVRLRAREALDRGRARMRVSIRRLQLQAASAGNPTMLIWLGKQYLQQRDMKGGAIDEGDLIVKIVKHTEDAKDD